MPDWSSIRRVFAGLCLIGGPALFFLGLLVRPDGSDDTGGELLAYVRVNGAGVQTSDLILIGAVCLLIPAFVGAMHVLRDREPLLGYVGGSLAVAGFACFIGLLALDGVALAMVPPASSAGAMAAVLDGAMHQPILGALTWIFVAAHIVGVTLLGIGLFRARFVPVWAAAVVTVSQPLHFVAHGIGNRPLDLLAFALIAAGLAALGVHVLRMRDGEWDAGVVVVSSSEPTHVREAIQA